MFIFTDALVLMLLLACGTETTSYSIDSEECQPWHENYSHSVTHCEEGQSIFIACNPRVRNRDQVPGCVDDLLLKCFEESDENCYSENVCMNLMEE